MSYDKMRKHQRSSIRKQKRKSYKMGMIFSIPSDKDVVYPEQTPDIGDYDTGELTAEQLSVATVLMEDHGFTGQPRWVEPGSLDRNLLAIDVDANGRTVIVKQDRFGFDFTFKE